MEDEIRRRPRRADPRDHPRTPRRRTVVAPLIDVGSWSGALVVAAALRDRSTAPPDFWSRVALIVGLAVAAQLTVGFSTDLYRAEWRVGATGEVAVLVRAVLVVTVVLVVTDLLSGRPVPTVAVVAGSALALIAATAIRSLWRLSQDRPAPPPGGRPSSRLTA